MAVNPAMTNPRTNEGLRSPVAELSPHPVTTNTSPSSGSVTLPNGQVIGTGNPGLGEQSQGGGKLEWGQWEGGVLVPGSGVYKGSDGSYTGSTPSSGGAAKEDDGTKKMSAVDSANAQALIAQMLDKYGLGSLASWAWPLVQQGYDANYVMAQLRDRPEFKQRFPAIEMREKAGLTPISPADYVQAEENFDQVMQARGLSGLFDRGDLYTKWIAGDVSASEADNRAQAAYQAAMGEPADVRAEGVRLFGGDAAGFATAYFLDPTNASPKIQQRLQSAEVAGGSTRSGYGLLTKDEAESLASLGITGQQAQSGFGDLTSKRELFGSLPGENVTDIGRDTQIAAEFTDDAGARAQIERRAGNRKAAVNSGAQYGVGSGGVQGLGSAAN